MSYDNDTEVFVEATEETELAAIAAAQSFTPRTVRETKED